MINKMNTEERKMFWFFKKILVLKLKICGNRKLSVDIVTKIVKRNFGTQKNEVFWEFKGRLVFIFGEKVEGRLKELTCSTQLVFN